MPVSTIGDLRQHFLTSRNNTALKSELGTLVQELTSGKVSDLTSHLGSGQTNLAGVDRQLEMLGRFAQSNTETGQLLSAMQTALAGVDGHRATTSGALLTIDASSSMTQITNAGSIATYGFEASVQSLNMRFGDRAMFGGTDLDTNPLSDPTDMLDALRLAVTGLTTAEDVGDAIDAWFDTPAGGFETTGYQGLTPANTPLIGITRWDAAPQVAALPGMQGGIFAMADAGREAAFRNRYEATYGTPPHPLASIAYDGIAAIGALAATGDRNALTSASLTRTSGFAGATGIFRLRNDGTNQRALAVARIVNNQVSIVEPAPTTFGRGGS